MGYNNLQTLAKTSIDNTYDYLQVNNVSTGAYNKILIAGLFPSFSTTGIGGEDVFVSITNKNQLNFKGIKSADATKLTATTDTNNILLTLVESGIDLSSCNNTTSGFLTAMDFTGAVTGENPVVNGGTGLSTIAKGAVLYASAVDTIAATAAMSTNGQVLIGNATTGIPTVATLTAGTNVTITNTAGGISIAASLSAMAAILDMANNNIDLGTGYISSDGSTSSGIRVTGANSYLGVAAAHHDSDILNIGGGGIRFSNNAAVNIKPNATAGDVVGQEVTVEAGSSAAGNAANLSLKGGTAASGGGNGGHVLVVAGSEAGGTAGSIKNSVYDGSNNAVQALSVLGGSANPNVVVDKGNLVVTEATKGIIHTGSGTVTQATDHTTAVTINTTSGVITLAAVALAATTNAEFTVTNSTVQADSVILVTMQDENTVNNKQLACAIHTVAGGSFKISIVNPHSASATSTTASKIHFLVINNS
tara:strand:- start:4327 stop:5757 length:1431 start_codon:yes stop_codon:yes gene_type:complete